MHDTLSVTQCLKGELEKKSVYHSESLCGRRSQDTGEGIAVGILRA